jgi:hypothetical protein
MSWVTWVTWAFVGVAALVALVALGLSRGRLHDSFDDPYDPLGHHLEQAPEPEQGRSGVEWSEPAAGWSPSETERDQHDDRDVEETDEPTAARPTQTTGEPADGRYEAQDR